MIKSTDKLWNVGKIFNKENKKVETVINIKFKGMVIKSIALSEEDKDTFKELDLIHE